MCVSLKKYGVTSAFEFPDLQLTLSWREHNQPNEVWAQRYHSKFANAVHFLEQSRAARSRQRWMRIGLTVGVMAVLGASAVYLGHMEKIAQKRAIKAEGLAHWNPFDGNAKH